MKRIATLLSCLFLSASLSSCQSAGALLNSPGKIINTILRGPVIPHIPTNFGENGTLIPTEMTDPLDATPRLSGEEAAIAASPLLQPAQG